MNLPFDWTIRNAVPADAPAIAAILRDCWPDDTADEERIARRIGDGRCTLCAWSDGGCVGFVDAFLTVGSSAVRRWEVDLLAVSAAARGRGIGAALVVASVDAAPDGAHLARGLVRVGNAAAERSFAAAGFRPDPPPGTLHVAPAQGMLAQLGTVHVVAVHTLTYSGLWLDSRSDPGGLWAARGRAAEWGLDKVGMLARDAAAEAACRAAGYEAVGAFRWWVRAL